MRNAAVKRDRYAFAESRLLVGLGTTVIVLKFLFYGLAALVAAQGTIQTSPFGEALLFASGFALLFCGHEHLL